MATNNLEPTKLQTKLKYSVCLTKHHYGYEGITAHTKFHHKMQVTDHPHSPAALPRRQPPSRWGLCGVQNLSRLCEVSK